MTKKIYNTLLSLNPTKSITTGQGQTNECSIDNMGGGTGKFGKLEGEEKMSKMRDQSRNDTN